jgi:hypothetical protein
MHFPDRHSVWKNIFEANQNFCRCKINHEKSFSTTTHTTQRTADGNFLLQFCYIPSANPPTSFHRSSMDNYVDLGYLPPVESFDGNMAMDGDEYVRCSRCGYGGCDVRVSSCGCTLHAVRRICTESNCRKFGNCVRPVFDYRSTLTTTGPLQRHVVSLSTVFGRSMSNGHVHCLLHLM